MKVINSAVLVRLPRDVKELIRNGVYSLYTLTPEDAAYVLITDRNEQYFLTADGSIVSHPKVGELRAIVREAVTFSDRSTDGAMINVA